MTLLAVSEWLFAGVGFAPVFLVAASITAILVVWVVRAEQRNREIQRQRDPEHARRVR